MKGDIPRAIRKIVKDHHHIIFAGEENYNELLRSSDFAFRKDNEYNYTISGCTVREVPNISLQKVIISDFGEVIPTAGQWQSGEVSHND